METVESLETDSRTEVEQLRHSLLLMYATAALVLGWAWFPYMMFREWPLGINSAVSVALVTGGISAHLLGRKHHVLACLALLVCSILGASLLAAAHPSTQVMAFGVLVVVAANAVLGTWAALVASTLTWAAGTLAHNIAMNLPPTTLGNADTLLAYYLTAGSVWLAARPSSSLVQSALNGWAEARRALAEARARRAELYRTLHALEEATYRIERMNNELLVAERDSQEARILKGRFAATVSHELRAPLNLILGFSKLMALSPDSYGQPLPRAYRADIDAIYRNSQHLVALIDDILDLSQIEAQRLPLVKDCVDLEADIVAKAVDIVQPLIERKGLSLHLQLAGHLPRVLADPVRLRQALLNLLVNAIRFTERGSITVSTTSQNGALVVSVQDTGPGIAANDLPKLFQEFRQLQHTPTREAAGSGLGLSICKHLVRLHGGQIWVESQEKVGTTFSFSVPLSESDFAPAIVRTGDSRTSVPQSEHCLVVHDDVRVVRLLARTLSGFRIVGLPNTEQLVDLTERLHPRGIISTHAGARSIQTLLASTPYNVPVLSCTLPGIVDRDRLGPVLNYLVKPVTTEMVLTTMQFIEREDNTTVLLVDDDPDAVRLLERMLTGMPRPYRILKAYGGAQALEVLRGTVPDIIFLDWAMPDMDGPQVLDSLRSNECTRGIPVAIVSARDWVDSQATLGSEIRIGYQQPMDIATGTRCLQALLDAAAPAYLPSEQTLNRA